jgi:hypothetical protein
LILIENLFDEVTLALCRFPQLKVKRQQYFLGCRTKAMCRGEHPAAGDDRAAAKISLTLSRYVERDLLGMLFDGGWLASHDAASEGLDFFLCCGG